MMLCNLRCNIRRKCIFRFKSRLMSSSGLPSSNEGASPAVSTPSQSIQPTLKVMRLYKPKLYVQGVSGGSMLPISLSDRNSSQQEFALSSMLILPDSFGEIFLGNTFSSYISAINPYSCELRDVKLSANIQCGNDRVELHDNRYNRIGRLPPPNPAAVLSPGCSLDMVVDYPLSQAGNHVLRVGVAYVDPVTGENKSLRKFYRFGVQNPLVITFNQHSMLSQKQQQGKTIVEATIQNISKLPLFVDSIKFVPLLPFTAKEMQVNPVCKREDSNTLMWELLSLDYETQTLVCPQEELQRVFCISWDPASDPMLFTAENSQNLGQLHVGWKTSMGEAGSVQSEPVMLKVVDYIGAGPGQQSEVIVAVAEIPEEVVVGQPFLVAVSLTNNSIRSLTLQLQFRKELMDGIVCSSVSHQNVGVMEAKTSRTIWVEFLAVVSGLRVLGGPVCVDIRSGQEFTQKAVLAHVLVGSHPSLCKTVE